MNQAAAILIFVTVFLGLLATIALGLRLYCRRYQKIPLGTDDYLVIAALVLSWGVSIASDVTAANTGVGDKSYVPSMGTLIFAMKMNYFCENTSIAVMGIVKVAWLLYYKRIFVTKPFVIAANTLIVITTSFTLAILLGMLFSKWPVRDQWNPEVPYNINLPVFLIFYVAFNAALDLSTLVLPLTAVRTLQMASHRKNILSIIFSLGSLAIFSSLFRLYYAVRYTKAKPSPSNMFEAPFIYNMLWAIIEQPVFILANCLLTLGPLYRTKYGPKNWFSSIRSLMSSWTTKSHRTTDKTERVKSAEHVEEHPWKLLPNLDGSDSQFGPTVEISAASLKEAKTSYEPHAMV